MLIELFLLCRVTCAPLVMSVAVVFLVFGLYSFLPRSAESERRSVCGKTDLARVRVTCTNNNAKSSQHRTLLLIVLLLFLFVACYLDGRLLPCLLFVFRRGASCAGVYNSRCLSTA